MNPNQPQQSPLHTALHSGQAGVPHLSHVPATIQAHHPQQHHTTHPHSLLPSTTHLSTLHSPPMTALAPTTQPRGLPTIGNPAHYIGSKPPLGSSIYTTSTFPASSLHHPLGNNPTHLSTGFLPATNMSLLPHTNPNHPPTTTSSSLNTPAIYPNQNTHRNTLPTLSTLPPAQQQQPGHYPTMGRALNQQSGSLTTNTTVQSMLTGPGHGLNPPNFAYTTNLPPLPLNANTGTNKIALMPGLGVSSIPPTANHLTLNHHPPHPTTLHSHPPQPHQWNYTSGAAHPKPAHDDDQSYNVKRAHHNHQTISHDANEFVHLGDQKTINTIGAVHNTTNSVHALPGISKNTIFFSSTTSAKNSPATIIPNPNPTGLRNPMELSSLLNAPQNNPLLQTISQQLHTTTTNDLHHSHHLNTTTPALHQLPHQPTQPLQYSYTPPQSKPQEQSPPSSKPQKQPPASTPPQTTSSPLSQLAQDPRHPPPVSYKGAYLPFREFDVLPFNYLTLLRAGGRQRVDITREVETNLRRLERNQTSKQKHARCGVNYCSLIVPYVWNYLINHPFFQFILTGVLPADPHYATSVYQYNIPEHPTKPGTSANPFHLSVAEKEEYERLCDEEQFSGCSYLHNILKERYSAKHNPTSQEYRYNHPIALRFNYLIIMSLLTEAKIIVPEDQLTKMHSCYLYCQRNNITRVNVEQTKLLLLGDIIYDNAYYNLLRSPEGIEGLYTTTLKPNPLLGPSTATSPTHDSGVIGLTDFEQIKDSLVLLKTDIAESVALLEPTFGLDALSRTPDRHQHCTPHHCIHFTPQQYKTLVHNPFISFILTGSPSHGPLSTSPSSIANPYNLTPDRLAQYNSPDSSPLSRCTILGQNLYYAYIDPSNTPKPRSRSFPSDHPFGYYGLAVLIYGLICFGKIIISGYNLRLMFGVYNRCKAMNNFSPESVYPPRTPPAPQVVWDHLPKDNSLDILRKVVEFPTKHSNPGIAALYQQDLIAIINEKGLRQVGGEDMLMDLLDHMQRSPTRHEGKCFHSHCLFCPSEHVLNTLSHEFIFFLFKGSDIALNAEYFKNFTENAYGASDGEVAIYAEQYTIPDRCVSLGADFRQRFVRKALADTQTFKSNHCLGQSALSLMLFGLLTVGRILITEANLMSMWSLFNDCKKQGKWTKEFLYSLISSRKSEFPRFLPHMLEE